MTDMDKVEQYAIKVHETAIAEGEKYAKEHGQSITEEVAYGRGFKAGAIYGYHQAEKDITDDDVKFIIDKYSELPIQYGPKLFEEIAKQLKQHRP